jgi:hypothetical protein
MKTRVLLVKVFDLFIGLADLFADVSLRRECKADEEQ